MDNLIKALSELQPKDLDILCKYRNAQNIKELMYNIGTLGNEEELYDAVSKNDVLRVEKLIRDGINMAVEGGTAIMIATAENHVNILQKLLDAGANPNLIDIFGNTSLMVAAEHGYSEVVGKLIAAGADINMQNKNGYTALMHASGHDDEDIVEQLINAGANVNMQNNYGYTALFFASQIDDPNRVQLLIDNGTNVNIQNKYGYTALLCALDHNALNAAKKLIDNGASITPGVWKFARRDTNVMELLQNYTRDKVNTLTNDLPQLHKYVDKVCYNLKNNYNIGEVQTIANVLGINTSAIDRSTKEELCALISAKIIIGRKEPSMKRINAAAFAL